MAEERQPVHPQLAEDLALYALGSLDATPAANLERHLGQCGDCRRDLQDLRAGVAAMALSTAGAAPPQRSRQRLMEAIAAEPRAAERRTVRLARPWWSYAPLFASLALVAFSLLLISENIELKRNNDGLASMLDRSQREAARMHAIAGMVTDASAQRVTLVSTGAPPQPQIRTIYQPRTGRILLLASNLAPLPEHKAYELWLLPNQGAPIPAGVFRPDAKGSAVLAPPESPALPVGTEAKNFAVTIENESGSATPTMPIVMLGAGQ